jgi:hypothetical protein
MIDENEMVRTLKDVTERLGDLRIDYMVTGSFAMSAYTVARTTMDIDVVLEIHAADAERFERRFSGDYYVDAFSIVRADKDQSMFNIINNSTLVKVDCIVKKTDAFESEKFARRRRSAIGGTDFWVIRKEDLILSKLRWAAKSLSERQFEDIGRLLETGVDADSLSASIETLRLQETWTAFKEWKTRLQT